MRWPGRGPPGVPSLLKISFPSALDSPPEYGAVISQGFPLHIPAAHAHPADGFLAPGGSGPVGAEGPGRRPPTQPSLGSSSYPYGNGQYVKYVLFKHGSLERMSCLSG